MVCGRVKLALSKVFQERSETVLRKSYRLRGPYIQMLARYVCPTLLLSKASGVSVREGVTQAVMTALVKWCM